MYKKSLEAVKYIKSQLNDVPEIGLILGTGLSSVAEMVDDAIVIPYGKIPGFAASTAPSHAGQLIMGTLAGKYIAILQGRFHYYEGYEMNVVTFPVRVLKLLGVKHLVITNAAGSLNENLVPGDIVLIKDHINFMGVNPLIGTNFAEFGDRFPSMHEPYKISLRNLAKDIATKHNFTLKEGVYVAVSGPSLETIAECRMFIKLGADLVGMSTVPEVIVAIHSGMDVIGISIVTNLSNVFHSNPHSQEEIRENAAKAKEHLILLIKDLVGKI